MLVCWFVSLMWLVGLLVAGLLAAIELSLLVYGVSGPANPGTAAEWPAGQLDIYIYIYIYTYIYIYIIHVYIYIYIYTHT